ncbi:MAG: sensor domain-containing diguanylate cyclase [Dehalococcoidia bacterium]|nr:sensor domain-containing diguanylate cyclase [Dehalococcoidia bacterium]MDZ4278347.1 sensor domain-containing diguanylate cyclase [Dehalococcoidia bacterium]
MARKSWLQKGKKDQQEAEATKREAAPAPPKQSGTERERQLHGLTVLSLFLHSVASVEEMMAALLEHASTVTGAVLVYPLLLERKRQVLKASMLEGVTDEKLEAAMDAFQEDLTALEFSLVQNSELYRILEGGEVVIRDSLAILVDGVVSEEQWKAAEEALRVRRLAFVPMVVENEPLGMVVFAFDQDRIDVEALELLVGHLTLALRDLLMRDEAIRFTDIDPVTWVHNRRALVQTIESEIIRAGRYGRSLSLVALDIDGFTDFNSSYGQSMGDRLLRTVGTTLAETVSPPELVARLKDDDFVVLLPETSRSAAVTATTRLLASLTHVSVFAGDDEAEPVTVSVAIASFPDDASTAHALMKRALAQLETAKKERAEERAKKARAEEDRLPAAGEAGH